MSNLFYQTKSPRPVLDRAEGIYMYAVDGKRYIEEIADYFNTTVEDIVIYDLFHNLQKYAEFTKLGTLFLFFHMLQRETETYPLFFVEIECKFSSTRIDFSFPRELILLNTPAINYFKFGNLLTIPRASSPAHVKERLGAMEQFIQTQYGSHKPFILETTFAGITHEEDGFPQIKSRLGLQIVTNEDKKLLDYSEIMTAMELGAESKFPHFIDDYIRGTVPSHQNETDQNFIEKYPRKKPARYLPESPIPINNSQKKILMALSHEKNKYTKSFMPDVWRIGQPISNPLATIAGNRNSRHHFQQPFF
jgi:hypothetical protein